MKQRYSYDGSLARKLVNPLIPAEREFERIEEERSQRRLRLEYRRRVQQSYRISALQRLRLVSILLAVILLMALMVSLIVQRFARITEMSFINAGIVERINQLEHDNEIMNNKQANISELGYIKVRAMNELGMQKADSSQIIYAQGQSNDQVLRLDSPEQSVMPVVTYTAEENVATVREYVRMMVGISK